MAASLSEAPELVRTPPRIGSERGGANKISPSPSRLLSLSLSLSLALARCSSEFSSSPAEMGFLSFAGRVLFASFFVLTAYLEFSEFGLDGGPAAKALAPKYDLFTNHVSTHLGVKVPEVDIKHIVIATIVLRGLGGLLFIFSSSFGAYLLLLYLALVTPLLYDFYNYDIEKPEFVLLFVKFTQNLALLGAALFFIGIKNSMPKKQAKKIPKTKIT